MKEKIERTLRPHAARPALLALVVAAAAPAALRAQVGAAAVPYDERTGAASPSAVETPETVIQKWPERPRDIARAMIEKYGEPEHFNDNTLVWYYNGAWKRSVAYRDAWPHYVLLRDKDYLEQTISYQIPADKVSSLKRFDERISVDKVSGELSARSESEPLNYLALNLAEEIVTGKRSVDDARAFYVKTEEFSRSGKSSPYLDGFIFPTEDAGIVAPSDSLSP